jgi:FkbM family methyltransferase
MIPLLETFAALRADVFFVQIGANDGEQQDPLRDLVLAHQWEGIMVEPVPYVFERLRANYGHLSRLTLENCAIGAEDGELPFYHLPTAEDPDRQGLPSWFDGLGSLRKEVVLAHDRFIPDIAERLVETMVPALTFESLRRKHQIDRVDLLLTDTEGYDYEILRQIDFARIRPALIIYESEHLSDRDRAACLEQLHRCGYDTLDYGLDTWCLNVGDLSRAERDALLPIWRWAGRGVDGHHPLAATRAIRAVGRRIVGGARSSVPHADA